MKRRFEGYERLARGLFGVSSLWLGPDDLLYVRGTGVLLPFVEEYLRFDPARIQSATIVRTRTGMVLNLAFGVPALVLVGAGTLVLRQAWASDGDRATVFYALAVPAFGLAAVCLLLLLINLALGPTCRFQIQTAARVTPVRPLGRLRPARRVLARLIPVVAAAQAGAPGHADGPAVSGSTAP
jgi:hypothetical protein